jgi:PAN domain
MRMSSRIAFVVISLALLGSATQAVAAEKNTDRPGGDYTNVTLPHKADPKACHKLCNADHGCRAWTYVKAGVQAANPRCWLKNVIPPPVPNPCCVSGVK